MNMPKLPKRILIYITIIVALFLWLYFGGDYCNFLGSTENNCGLVLLRLGVIVITVVVMFFDLLISIIRWIIENYGVLAMVLIVLFLVLITALYILL